MNSLVLKPWRWVGFFATSSGGATGFGTACSSIRFLACSGAFFCATATRGLVFLPVTAWRAAVFFEVIRRVAPCAFALVRLEALVLGATRRAAPREACALRRRAPVEFFFIR